MRGRLNPRRIGGIAIVSGMAALVGYTLSKVSLPKPSPLRPQSQRAQYCPCWWTRMIPEAFEETHDFAGLITVTGFLAALVLIKLGG
jgi:ZIP family zinc transporter